MKLLRDTLMEAGKWSIKRWAGISAFYVAVAYAFLPLVVPSFEVHEFVFWGFITLAGAALGLTTWAKVAQKKMNQKNDEE